MKTEGTLVSKYRDGGQDFSPIKIKNINDIVDNSFKTKEEAEELLDNAKEVLYNDIESVWVDAIEFIYGEVPKIVEYLIVAKEINDNDKYYDI